MSIEYYWKVGIMEYWNDGGRRGYPRLSIYFYIFLLILHLLRGQEFVVQEETDDGYDTDAGKNKPQRPRLVQVIYKMHVKLGPDYAAH